MESKIITLELPQKNDRVYLNESLLKSICLAENVTYDGINFISEKKKRIYNEMSLQEKILFLLKECIIRCDDVENTSINVTYDSVKILEHYEKIISLANEIIDEINKRILTKEKFNQQERLSIFLFRSLVYTAKSLCEINHGKLELKKQASE